MCSVDCTLSTSVLFLLLFCLWSLPAYAAAMDSLSLSLSMPFSLHPLSLLCKFGTESSVQMFRLSILSVHSLCPGSWGWDSLQWPLKYWLVLGCVSTFLYFSRFAWSCLVSSPLCCPFFSVSIFPFYFFSADLILRTSFTQIIFF